MHFEMGDQSTECSQYDLDTGMIFILLQGIRLHFHMLAANVGKTPAIPPKVPESDHHKCAA
jgi:hypothetical protein